MSKYVRSNQLTGGSMPKCSKQKNETTAKGKKKMLLLMTDVTKLHREVRQFFLLTQDHSDFSSKCKFDSCGVTCTCSMCLKTKEAGQELTDSPLRWRWITVSFYSAPLLWPSELHRCKDTVSCHDKQNVIAHHTQTRKIWVLVFNHATLIKFANNKTLFALFAIVLHFTARAV